MPHQNPDFILVAAVTTAEDLDERFNRQRPCALSSSKRSRLSAATAAPTSSFSNTTISPF